MRETQPPALGQEGALEEGMAPHSSIHGQRSLGATVHGVPKSWTQLSYFKS